jgi:SAM-dependent methyltransferase
MKRDFNGQRKSWKERLRERQQIRIADASTDADHMGGAASSPMRRNHVGANMAGIAEPKYLNGAAMVPVGVRAVKRPEREPAVALDHLIHNCVCGSAMFISMEENGLQLHVCVACGVRHQALNMTVEQLEDWYATQYQTYRVDTGRLFERDLAVAKSRLDQYGTQVSGRVLDIGTANGAFVAACRERGLDAWGQDISRDSLSDHVYAGPLESIHFPTDYFNTVTMHDVFEHVVDPWTFLAEAHRLTAQGGTLIIDFPDFDAPEGVHHWKSIEHIWLFTAQQLLKLASDIGFEFQKMDRPIPGRFMAYFTKRKERRTTILVAPGIGDSFWAIGKLRSFCEKNNLGLPDVWISDMGDRKRSLEAVQKFPFVNAAGYRTGNHGSKVWHEAYMLNGRQIFLDHCGCDFFVAANGGLRHGMSMEQIMPEYRMDWYPPMFRSKREDEFMRDAKNRFGRYIVAYFLDVGMYTRWIGEFGPGQIIQALKKIQKELDVKILFTGAPWDRGKLPTQMVKLANDKNFVDFTGGTDFEQLMGLYRGAEGSIGYPSGSTIMGTVVKVPTLMLWNKYFVEDFWRHCCAPDSLNKWYGIIDTAKARPDTLAKQFVDLLRNNPR